MEVETKKAWREPLRRGEVAMRNRPANTEKSLTERRQAVGLSIVQLARSAGVRYDRVWKACSGGFKLTPEEFKRLDAALSKNGNGE